jgi:hypothetical protein
MCHINMEIKMKNNARDLRIVLSIWRLKKSNMDGDVKYAKGNKTKGNSLLT